MSSSSFIDKMLIRQRFLSFETNHVGIFIATGTEMKPIF